MQNFEMVQSVIFCTCIRTLQDVPSAILAILFFSSVSFQFHKISSVVQTFSRFINAFCRYSFTISQFSISFLDLPCFLCSQDCTMTVRVSKSLLGSLVTTPEFDAISTCTHPVSAILGAQRMVHQRLPSHLFRSTIFPIFFPCHFWSIFPKSDKISTVFPNSDIVY